MSARMPWHWPRSLFARLALILCVGLALAQTLSFWLTVTERDQATTNLMMGYIEREVASSVALLVCWLRIADCCGLPFGP